MPKKLDSFLLVQSSRSIALFALLLIAVVGVVDAATGHELSFSIFYTIPVGMGAWYAGRNLGSVVSLLSAMAWMAADYIADHEYSHLAILFWNTGVRLGFFVIIALLLNHIRVILDVQETLVQKDSLTGLLNAHTFKQRSDSIFALASRHGRPLALGYLDLDGFKSINDSFGHKAGDQVLRAVGAALAKRLRASDIGGRIGGDEFAILLPETDLAGAQNFFKKLHEDLISVTTTNHWVVGFSIGVAVYLRPAANSDDAIGVADELMYTVKKSGKNNIRFEEYPGLLSGS